MNSPARPRPLLDRDVELSLVGEAIGAARAGPGVVVLICAEAGLGRSALVDAVVGQWERPAWQECGCDLPTHAAALTQLWRAVLAHGSGLIVVDDAHRAPPGALVALRQLALDIVAHAGTLLLTSTPRPPQDPIEQIADLAAERGALRRVTLRPLTEDSMREVAHRLLGRRPTPDEVTSLAAVGGNPGLLHDLLAEMPGRRCGSAPDEPTRRIRLRHLADLTPDTVELMRQLAVLDPDTTMAELCALGLGDPAAIAHAVSEALRAGLLRATDRHRLSLRYLRAREVLAGQVPEPVRDDLRRRAARRLTEERDDPPRAARLLSDTMIRDDDLEMVAVLDSQLAEVGVPEAVNLWQAAVRSPALGRRARDVARCGQAWAWLEAGRAGLADRAAQECADQPDLHSVTARRAHHARVVALLAQGNWRQAHQVCQLRLVAESAVTALRAAADGDADDLALLAVSAALAGAIDESRAALAGLRMAGLLGATPSNAPPWLSDAAAVAVAATALHDGHLIDAEAALRGRPGGDRIAATVSSGRGGPSREAAAWAGLRAALHGQTLHLLDRPGPAGSAWAQARAGAFAVLAVGVPAYLWADGVPLEQARAATRDLAALAERAGADPWRLAAARLSCELDSRDAEACEITSLPDHTATTGYAGAWAIRGVLACVAAQGDVARSRHLLDEVWPHYVGAGAADRIVLAADLAVLCARCRDAQRAAAVTSDLAGLASRNEGVGWLRSLAEAAAGLATAAGEQVVAAARSLPPHRIGLRARLLDAGAELLRHAGRRAEAMSAATQARADFDELGWSASARRVRASCGGPAPSQSIARSGAAHDGVDRWQSLTHTERVVAAHVEQGLSNAQIAAALVVSRRTVETHVSHILAKLSLRSRSELIVAALASRADPPSAGDAAQGQRNPTSRAAEH